MSTNKNKKRIGVVAGTMAVALVGGGLAVAYWTTTGAGTGAGTVGTNTAVTVAQTSTVSGLVPGGPSQPLNFTVTNPGAGPQVINNVNITVSTTAPGCNAADFVVSQPTIPANQSIAGSGGTYSNTTASVSMTNTAANQDACKGAALTFNYAVS